MRDPYKLSRINENEADASSLDSLSQSQILQLVGRLVGTLKTKHGLSNQEILAHVPKSSVSTLPISIFRNKLSPLEAVVQYLKDEQNWSLHKIAQQLSRDDRTIWTTYTNAKKKAITLDTSDPLLIPFALFSNRVLSVLEHVVIYLKETLTMSNKEIAQLISRSNKTIWTVYDRARKKST